MTRSVFVTGHVRSGTSMTAGIFAAHGVFFGACGGRVADSPKGRMENRWLKRTVEHGDRDGWPETWYDRLRAEGWDGEVPWGAKLMPKWWDWIRATQPTVIVCCYRPVDDILASCERVGWPRSRKTVDQRWRRMGRIAGEHVVNVWTPSLIKGCYDAIEDALSVLGLALDREACAEWIEPEHFHA